MDNKTSKRPEEGTENLIRGSVFLLFLIGAFAASTSMLPLVLTIDKTFVCIWSFSSLIIALFMSSSTLGVFVIPVLVFQLGYVFEEMAIKFTGGITNGTFKLMFLAYFAVSAPVLFLVSTASMNSSRKIREAVQSTEVKNAAISRLI